MRAILKETPPGLPEALPDGERVLWQGRPDWRALAGRVFWGRAITLWFGALTAWRLGAGLLARDPLVETLLGGLWMFLLGGVALAIVSVIAWATARTTIYTITSERVAMKIGVALPIAVNFPFGRIAAVDLKGRPDGTGELALKLTEQGLGWAVLWPHAKPWRMKRPEPMMRCLPDIERAAQTLAEALRDWEARRLGARAAPLDAGQGRLMAAE